MFQSQNQLLALDAFSFRNTIQLEEFLRSMKQAHYEEIESYLAHRSISQAALRAPKRLILVSEYDGGVHRISATFDPLQQAKLVISEAARSKVLVRRFTLLVFKDKLESTSKLTHQLLYASTPHSGRNGVFKNLNDIRSAAIDTLLAADCTILTTGLINIPGFCLKMANNPGRFVNTIN